MEYELTVQETSRQKEFSFYNIFWIFVAGGVIGCILETIWCCFVFGEYSSRSSNLFFPISTVWGLGAVLFTLLLKGNMESSSGLIFLKGYIMGGMFEFVCGFLCEKVLDVTFWDYSALPFSLGRYVNLVFCCFWGLAALCWCRKIYPMIRRILMEKTRKSSRLLTQGFAVFMLLTTLMSGAALFRMSERSRNLPPQNRFEQYLDQHYSDEILQRCFPKMKPADLVIPSDQYLANR